MKSKIKSDHKRFWVAVRVERGYVSEAKVFESVNAAKQTERRWRNRFNPDYDETAVISGSFVPSRKRNSFQSL